MTDAEVADRYYALTHEGRRRRLKRVAVRALADYDVEAVRLRGLTDATNGVFRVDASDGRRYALRVGLGPPTGHSPAEVASELEFMRAVAAASGVTVPMPIRTRDGRWFTIASTDDVPHRRTCVVFSWLEGSLLADRVEDVGLEGFGQTAARLHLAARRFEASDGFTIPRFDRVYPYDLPFIVFSDAGTDLLPPGRRRLFEEGRSAVEEGLARLERREPMRVIHGDLHGWNIKTHHGSLSVFDFEDLVWGWPVQDLATALYYYWSGDDFDRRWDETRRGYEALADWPDPGTDIATFIIARTLLIANDVLSQPEWMPEAPAIYERGERRIRDMLSRIG